MGEWYADRFELVKSNNKTEAVDDHVRFMVYGTQCDNKSELYRSEKNMKSYLKECSKDRSWTGKIIGYKMVPLYEAQETTQLKSMSIKKTSVKKKTKVKK